MIDTNRIMTNYITKLKTKYNLDTDTENLIKNDLKDLVDSIIDEIKNNSEISIDVVINNPTGLLAGTYPVTGSTIPNSNMSTGSIK